MRKENMKKYRNSETDELYRYAFNIHLYIERLQ